MACGSSLVQMCTSMALLRASQAAMSALVERIESSIVLSLWDTSSTRSKQASDQAIDQLVPRDCRVEEVDRTADGHGVGRRDRGLKTGVEPGLLI